MPSPPEKDKLTAGGNLQPDSPPSAAEAPTITGPQTGVSAPPAASAGRNTAAASSARPAGLSPVTAPQTEVSAPPEGETCEAVCIKPFQRHDVDYWPARKWRNDFGNIVVREADRLRLTQRELDWYTEHGLVVSAEEHDANPKKYEPKDRTATADEPPGADVPVKEGEA